CLGFWVRRCKPRRFAYIAVSLPPPHHIMKTIRVFVSSPGDVQAERTIADRLIGSIAEELGIPVSVQYSNLLRDAQCPQTEPGLARRTESKFLGLKGSNK